MQSFFSILKAMIWGALLLTFVLITAVKALNVSSDFENILPSGMAKKVEITYQAIGQKLETLSTLYYERNTSRQINSLRDEIRAEIDKLCSDCKLKSFYPTGGLEVSMYKSYLELRSSNNMDKFNNRVYLAAGVFSILSICFGFLLIYSLWRYRADAKSLVVFIGLAIPVYFVLLSASTCMLEGYYLSFKLGTNDFPANLMIFSFIYFFIAYPAIYVLSKKFNISFRRLLFLK